MTSNSSKAIPFVIMFFIGSMLAVDMFTDFTITENHISVIGIIASSLGLGGIWNRIAKGYQKAKESKNEKIPKWVEDLLIAEATKTRQDLEKKEPERIDGLSKEL